jgi:8-oxo-dGTP diphosphatase
MVKLSWQDKIITPRVGCCVVVEGNNSKLLIIKRKYEPYGLAFPGGMVNINETISEAAKREILEETGIGCDLFGVIHILSNPKYDPRWAVVNIVFVGAATNFTPIAADDAEQAFWADYPVQDVVKSKLTEGSRVILKQYGLWKRDQRRKCEVD